MTIRRIGQFARLAGGFRNFLRAPISLAEATDAIKRQLDQRESSFINCTKTLIYDVSHSPYRRLLLWAGCDYGDLCASVRSLGVESTLAKLRDEGVYLSLDEFKSRLPIGRKGLHFETSVGDFENPLVLGRIVGQSSGSRGERSSVQYDWDYIADAARHEALVYAVHGVADAPFILWYPVPPGVAGIMNLLKSLKLGMVPQQWYSQSPCGVFETSIEARLALEFVIRAGRLAGMAVPRPIMASLSDHEAVVRWMESTLRHTGRAVLRGFGSSALRMIQTARRMGANLRSGLVLVGGEPLTEPRRRYFESAGLEVYPRYNATEAGIIAGACPNRSAADDMHFFSDRLAMVQREGEDSLVSAKTFLFTTLSMSAGKVLFNTAIGDFGEVTSRSCSCLMGEMGLDVHLSSVCSDDKLTVEGMTILTAELEAIIGAAIERIGGAPDCYQFWESADSSGLHRLTIAVSPQLSGFNEGRLVESIIEGLRRGGTRTAMAADFWEKADSFLVIREEPVATAGHKMPAINRSRQRA